MADTKPILGIVRGQVILPGLTVIGRQLRAEPTPAEARLWMHLRDRQLSSVRFRRQQIIGACIVDFYCHQHALVVELDGSTHEPQHDAERDAILKGKGLRTIRFSNSSVFNNIEHVLQQIEAALKDLPEIRCT